MLLEDRSKRKSTGAQQNQESRQIQTDSDRGAKVALTGDRLNSDSDEELKALVKIIETSVKGRRTKRKLEQITAREAAALLGYIDSIEIIIAKRTRSVTDRDDRDVDYDKDELQTGLIKLVKIATTPTTEETERGSSSE